jgi:hypothetical protein
MQETYLTMFFTFSNSILASKPESHASKERKLVEGLVKRGLPQSNPFDR